MIGREPEAVAGLLILARISAQASIVIALVLLAHWTFRRHLSANWKHALWLLVLVRLTLPWSFESPLSVFNWLLPTALRVPAPTVAVTSVPVTVQGATGDTGAPRQQKSEAHSTSARPVSARLELVSRAGDASKPEPRGRWIWIGLGVLWAAGAGILALRVLWETWQLRRAVVPVRLATNSAVLELLEDCRQQMGVRVPLVLVQTKLVSSPVLYGFVRPRLLLPEGLLQNFSHEELRFVFLHELAHVARRDIAVSWLMTALQVVHWFNPLVWFAFARMRADRELACDALALQRAGDSAKKDYGCTMLRLLEDFQPTSRMPCLAGILEDPNQMETRIRSIAGFTGRSPWPGWAIGLLLLLALLTLTNGREYTSNQAGLVPARLIFPRGDGSADIRSLDFVPEPETIVPPSRIAEHEFCITALDAAPDGANQYRKIGVLKGVANDRWEASRSSRSLSARHGHTAVWTGEELIAWGGGFDGAFKFSGGCYNAKKDTWRSTTVDGGPVARWGHVSVWTGREMIIWGGRPQFAATNHFADGACYNPQTDTWRPMTRENLPAPRSQSSVIWTGTEMIIWGGWLDGEIPCSDGARYNPVTDEWKPLAAAPLAGRVLHTTVWTGEEIIIWGGLVGPPWRDLNDGARYHPGLDRWTMLPMADAPSPRGRHAAVWTGEELIVWGGGISKSNTCIRSGGRYHLAQNRWSSMATNQAPEERVSALSLWTGSEMIVWGGVTFPHRCLNSGALYDPATDRWRTMSLERAPKARMFTDATSFVWTGERLIFFGGYDLTQELGDTFTWRPPTPMALYQRLR